MTANPQLTQPRTDARAGKTAGTTFTLVAENDTRRVAEFFGVPEIALDIRPLLPTAKSWAGYDRKGMEHPGKNHPAFVQAMIKRYSVPGDLVLDPCAGVGTMLVEALKLGRLVRGCEVEQPYFDALRRNVSAAHDANRGRFAPGVCVVGVYRGDFRSSECRHERSDLVLTSPPFPQNHAPGNSDMQRRRLIERTAYAGTGWSTEAGGNLCAKGADYWRGIEELYRCCYPPNGEPKKLVVIARDYVRKNRIVPFCRRMVEAIQAGGWTFREVVSRPLQPSCGHARRLKENHRAVFCDREYALVFEAVSPW